MTPSAPILDARSIRKSFRMGDSEIDVLKGVDFAVHEGEFVAIEGRSGSGKSTLLHILGSLESLGDGTTAYSGSEYTLREPPAEAWLLSRLRSLPMAVVNELSSIIAQILLVMKVVTKEQMTVWCLLVAVGIICQLLALSYLVAITLHWWRWREYRRQQRRAAGLRNRAFGFVFQFYHLLPELNVLENVMLPAMVEYSFFRYLAKRRELRQRAIDILTELGLSHRLKHRSSQLSGGERQRVAIARALMNSPKVLFADEPTGNLDIETGRQIMHVLEMLHNKGQTIVMVTHDRTIARQADRVVVLAEGRLREVR